MLTLTRTYKKNYTRGELKIPNSSLKLDTLELTYNNNKRDISCIPEKKYIVKCNYSMTFGDCLKLYEPVIEDYWYMLEEDKRHIIFKRPRRIKEVDNREGILIHSGNAVANFSFYNSQHQLINYKSNSKGCILVGSGFFEVKDIINEEQAYITGSKKALAILYDYVKEEGGFTDLYITNNNKEEHHE